MPKAEDATTAERLKRIEQMLEGLTAKVLADTPETSQNTQFLAPGASAEGQASRDVNNGRVPIRGIPTGAALVSGRPYDGLHVRMGPNPVSR